MPPPPAVLKTLERTLTAAVNRALKKGEWTPETLPSRIADELRQVGPAAGAEQNGMAKVLIQHFSEICREPSILGMCSCVLDAIYALLPVERATVFLADWDASVLRVVSARDSDLVAIPIRSGIAGAVMASGKSEIVPDAQSDTRFNKEIDKQTGFVTSSILCVAVNPLDEIADADERTTRASAVEKKPLALAALQALNKRVGGKLTPFTDDDLKLLELLSSLLSGVFARASLCEEAVRERARNAALLDCNIAVHSAEEARIKAMKVMGAVKVGLDCERSSMLLVDEVQQQLCLMSTPLHRRRARRCGRG